MRSSVPATRARRRGRGAASRVWGDGFHTDDVMALARVTDHRSLDVDELAVLHPALAARDHARMPSHLASRLAQASAVADARIGFLRGAGSLHPAHSDWFAAGRLRLSAWKRLGLGPASPRAMARDAAVADGLHSLSLQAAAGLPPCHSPSLEALFAFGSGIHPGHVWPESAIAPGRGYAAAWLGIVCRGRQAYMPPAVAEYVADGILLHDGDLVAMAGMPVLRRMTAAGRRRLQGEDGICGVPAATSLAGGAAPT